MRRQSASRAFVALVCAFLIVAIAAPAFAVRLKRANSTLSLAAPSVSCGASPGFDVSEIRIARVRCARLCVLYRGRGCARVCGAVEAAERDSAGNVVLTAFSVADANYGGGSLPAHGSPDLVVAKYTGNGAHV
jgi:hypothetical protein